MKINALTLAESTQWSAVHLDSVSSGLNAIYGESGTGKSTISDFIAHVLFGKQPKSKATRGRNVIPEGGLVVESRGGRYRLQRTHDSLGTNRISIATLDGSLADQATVHDWLNGFSPITLSRFFVVDFQKSSYIEHLRLEKLAQDLKKLDEQAAGTSGRGAVSLVRERGVVYRDAALLRSLNAERKTLENALESRLAEERRIQLKQEAARRSVEESRSRINEELTELQREIASLTDQVRTMEIRISELESEIRTAKHEEERYAEALRQQERVVERPLPIVHEVDDDAARIEELEEHIAHWRSMLRDLEIREADLRSRLVSYDTDYREPHNSLAEQWSWLSVARRLATDLDHEVSQLSCPTNSARCVCEEAHPRLRPVVKTILRQLDAFEAQFAQFERSYQAKELREEASHLRYSQEALRRQLDFLIDRRESLSRRHFNKMRTTRPYGLADYRTVRYEEEAVPTRSYLPHVELRSPRLMEELSVLQHDRDSLCARLSHLEREQRETIVRREALVTSTHDISETPFATEIADFRLKLAELDRRIRIEKDRPVAKPAPRVVTGMELASDYLNRLTDGKYIGLQFARHGKDLVIANQHGGTTADEALSAAERDQVCLSMCLAYASVCRRLGLRLPLVLDALFESQNERGIETMANLLDEFCREGHQVLVLSSDLSGIERLRERGAKVDTLRLPVRSTTIPPIHTTRAIDVVEVDDQDRFTLHLDDPIQDFSEEDVVAEHLLASLGMKTIGDLLDADAEEVAKRLNRRDLSAETVQQWQSYAALMCFVPEVHLDDARLLADSGISCPETLATIDEDELHREIERFLKSKAGSRLRHRYSRSHVRRWASGARRNRNRWQNSRRWQRWNERSGARRRWGHRPSASNGTYRTRSREDRYENREPAVRASRTTRTTSRTTAHAKAARANESNWRFYLALEDEVQQAPSIGARTAERLAEVGIHTVSDLLNASPDETARRLDTRNISADTIRDWQRQAHLVCRIPQLRGHDAQILVSCGLTTPEQIAAMDPSSLLAQVTPFCNSKQGERIIRSGKKPDRAEVTDWIHWANNHRSLNAA